MKYVNLYYQMIDDGVWICEYLCYIDSNFQIKPSLQKEILFNMPAQKLIGKTYTVTVPRKKQALLYKIFIIPGNGRQKEWRKQMGGQT